MLHMYIEYIWHWPQQIACLYCLAECHFLLTVSCANLWVKCDDIALGGSNCINYLINLCFDTVGWVTGKVSGLQKSWVFFCWWWWFDWSFAHIIAPVVTTTTSIILSSNKSRMETFWYRLTQVHLEKWPLNQRVSGREY